MPIERSFIGHDSVVFFAVKARILRSNDINVNAHIRPNRAFRGYPANFVLYVDSLISVIIRQTTVRQLDTVALIDRLMKSVL